MKTKPCWTSRKFVYGSLLILFIAAAGETFWLIREIGDQPRLAPTNTSAAADWSSYFRRSQYLADARTLANLIVFLFEPSSPTASTNVLHG